MGLGLWVWYGDFCEVGLYLSLDRCRPLGMAQVGVIWFVTCWVYVVIAEDILVDCRNEFEVYRLWVSLGEPKRGDLRNPCQ